MLKKFIYLFILFFSSPVFSSDVSISAIVNGNIITSYDVKERVKLSRELLKINKYNMSDSDIEKQVLSEMIDDKIKIAEASRFGIRISPEELSDAMIRMEKYLNLPDGGYKKIIKDIGIDENVVNKQIEADVIWMKFVYSVLRNYVKVSDSEIDLLIENKKNDNLFKYDISSLIIPPKFQKENFLKLKDISSCDEFISFAKSNGENGSGLKFTLISNEMDKKLHNLLISSSVNKATNQININGKDTIFFICSKEKYTHEFSDAEREELKFSVLQNKLDAYSNKYFEKLKASSVIDIKNTEIKN